MVDGVPMNLTRDTSRGLSAIDPESIANIEVIRGSNAIYGGGASGGIISLPQKRLVANLQLKQSLDFKHL